MKLFEIKKRIVEDDASAAPSPAPAPSDPAPAPSPTPPAPSPAPAPTPPTGDHHDDDDDHDHDQQMPPGWGYHPSMIGLWGSGLITNLYWIISGERLIARMKEIGLTPKQRKRVKKAVDTAKEQFVQWLEGRNSQYNGMSGWTMMSVSTPYGTYKAMGKEGSKEKVVSTIKSKLASTYKSELRKLPKTIRKPIVKKKSK